MTDDDTITLVFDATQEARHQMMLRANELARALVQSSQAKAAGQKPDADGVLQGPQELRIVLGFNHEDKSAKQRAFLHAAVFPQIAEQVRMPDGTCYVAAIWKIYFRKLFLPDRWKSYRLPGAKRATPHRERISTESLNIKQYSEFIDKVIAHATTEFGVAFKFRAEEREAVRWTPKRRKAGVKHEPADTAPSTQSGAIPRPRDVPGLCADEHPAGAGAA